MQVLNVSVALRGSVPNVSHQNMRINLGVDRVIALPTRMRAKYLPFWHYSISYVQDIIHSEMGYLGYDASESYGESARFRLAIRGMFLRWTPAMPVGHAQGARPA